MIPALTALLLGLLLGYYWGWSDGRDMGRADEVERRLDQLASGSVRVGEPLDRVASERGL